MWAVMEGEEREPNSCCGLLAKSHLDVLKCLKDNLKALAVKPSVGTIPEREGPDVRREGRTAEHRSPVCILKARHGHAMGWSSGKVERTTDLGAG